MDILEGLKIKGNQFINWEVSFEELKEICQNENIYYQIEIIKMFKTIMLPVEFANLGIVTASFYYIDKTIKQISFTKETEGDFNIDKYNITKERLILYFGKPRIQNRKKRYGDLKKLN